MSHSNTQQADARWWQQRCEEIRPFAQQALCRGTLRGDVPETHRICDKYRQAAYRRMVRANNRRNGPSYRALYGTDPIR
jgi:hypothetical protein